MALTRPSFVQQRRRRRGEHVRRQCNELQVKFLQSSNRTSQPIVEFAPASPLLVTPPLHLHAWQEDDIETPGPPSHPTCRLLEYVSHCSTQLELELDFALYAIVLYCWSATISARHHHQDGSLFIFFHFLSPHIHFYSTRPFFKHFTCKIDTTATFRLTRPRTLLELAPFSQTIVTLSINSQLCQSPA